MAFAKTGLTKLGNITGVKQHWNYNAGADAVATAVAAGYFNDVRGMLRVGDRIDLLAASNAAFRVLTVATVPATGNVTVTAAAFS